MKWMTLIGVGLVAILSLAVAGQPLIEYTLSNFDVVNPDECCYDDFELYFYPLDCECFHGAFPGWGAPPDMVQLHPWKTCLVRWDSPDCVPPGESRHFGLYLDARDECMEPPRCIAAFWTVHGIPVRAMPIPFQYWDIVGDIVADIVIYDPACCPLNGDEVVTIDRWFAVLDEPLRLEAMMWGQVGPGTGEVPWEPWKMDEELVPGQDSSAIPMPLGPGQAALVAIAVRLNGVEVAHILNQAVRGQK